LLQDKHCELNLVKGAAAAAAAKATIRAMSKNAQTTLNGVVLEAGEDRYKGNVRHQPPFFYFSPSFSLKLFAF
jgi:hypothetical protein